MAWDFGRCHGELIGANCRTWSRALPDTGQIGGPRGDETICRADEAISPGHEDVRKPIRVINGTGSARGNTS
jgi:hypothetical protein